MRSSDFENELTTEQIRNRMIKNAARIWGVEIEDIESTFDPIVTMLIEACSYELNKINREMMSSRGRIMNRLAHTLSPETLTGAQPAHTIVQARSLEPETVINGDAQFSTSIRQHSVDIDRKEITKDIYFSPLRNYKLFDAQIRFAIQGNRIFEYKNAVSKQVLAEVQRSALNPHTLWLGIELNSKIQNLNQFVFFFDWKNDPDESKYIQLLPLTKWSIGPYKLDVSQGINQEIDTDDNTVAIDREYNVTMRTQKVVEKIYHDNFYTVTGGDATKIRLQDFLVPFPSEVNEIFPATALSKMQGKLIWLKLRFNSTIPVSAVQDVFVALNAFPCINRRLNRLTYQLRNNLNIIPLKSDNLFHDIQAVKSIDGVNYHSNPLGSGFGNSEGYYTLRNAGMERFDQRHATEQLTNLIDRLRDESAAFNSMGNDFINIQINQVNQALALIENRLDLKGTKERPTHFLLVRPVKKNDTVFVRFWSTDGPDAHAVKPGSPLVLQEGADIRSDSLQTIMTTHGGKLPLNENEKIIAFKKALLSRDRILTEKDIHDFCVYELGTLVKKISVNRAWEIPAERKSGITRIIEVRLFPSTNTGFVKSEWRDLAKSLQAKLRLQTTELIPINVVVNTPEYSEFSSRQEVSEKD